MGLNTNNKTNKLLIRMRHKKANLKSQQLKNPGTNLIWGVGGITSGGLLMVN